MTDPKDKPGTTQDRPNTDEPDFDITAPDIEYVQNDYNPDRDNNRVPLNEKKDK